MTGYIMNFGVYTMAMIGIIVVALLVYKKSTAMNLGKQGGLKIDEKIALNARKSLYVVNANGERFLIAGDMDNTSLIAKLGSGETISDVQCPMPEKQSYISRETEPVKMNDFKKELEAQKTLEKSFAAFENFGVQPKETISNVTAPKEFERRLDIKNIRKKPVMKELARKLAQV